VYIQWFIEHDWTVITVSRPGYGRTSSALAGHNGDFEAALCRLLDDLKVASATVVGISAGDRAAMRFVELYPERVNTLLLVSLASWPSTPTRIAVHILFNPLVKQATWALTRGLLCRYPEASLTQLIALLATLSAKSHAGNIRRLEAEVCAFLYRSMIATRLHQRPSPRNTNRESTRYNLPDPNYR